MAVIDDLRKKQGVDLLYIGSKNGIEKKLIEDMGVRYEGVSCGKLRRYFSWENFKDAFKLPIGFFEAKRVLREFSPNVIFSKGGFVSVPVVAAARWLKIPVILHESDLTPGLANKLCIKYASDICISFEDTRSHISKKYLNRVVVTGTPIREEIFQGDEVRGRAFTGLDQHRPVVLVMGGSQGAQQINDLIRGSLTELLKKFQIVHIVGKGNIDIGVHTKGYVQYEYLNEQMKDIYAMCEMVVSRGGANSLAEIAALKKRALIIPIGSEASRGEQYLNSKYFAQRMGWSVISGEITCKEFIENVKLAYQNELIQGELTKSGTKKIVKLIMEYEDRG